MMAIEEHEPLLQEDVSPTADEVAGYPGTVEEAVENGQLEPPPPLSWQRWQVWRTATGSRPDSLRIGSADSAREGLIWRRVMEYFHGSTARGIYGGEHAWRSLARD